MMQGVAYASDWIVSLDGTRAYDMAYSHGSSDGGLVTAADLGCCSIGNGC